MPRVIHFEISADEPARALRFYSDVFGWDARKWEGPDDYWLVTTGEEGQTGIDGGLYKRHEGMSFTSHVNTIDVPSVDEFIARITSHGGKAVTSKMHIPGVGYFAYCEDTEGNMFGIMQDDKSVH